MPQAAVGPAADGDGGNDDIEHHKDEKYPGYPFPEPVGDFFNEIAEEGIGVFDENHAQQSPEYGILQVGAPSEVEGGITVFPGDGAKGDFLKKGTHIFKGGADDSTDKKHQQSVLVPQLIEA